MWYYNILVVYVVIQVTKASSNIRGSEIGSYIPRDTGRSLIETHLEDCNESIRALEMDWSKINIICLSHFQLHKKIWMSNTYFETKSKEHFNHCHAISYVSDSVKNGCFNLKYSEDVWKRVDAKSYAKQSNLESDVCYVRHGVKYNPDAVTTWVQRQEKGCDGNGPAGFTSLPVGTIKKPPFGFAIRTRIPCINNGLNKSINWEKIRYVCMYFTNHDRHDVTEVYFAGRGNLKPFRHCYGSAIGRDSRCFPGSWNSKIWDHIQFETESNFFNFIKKDDMHCYVREGEKNKKSLSGKLLNWYKRQEKCREFDPAGFYNYDRKSYGV